MLRLIEYFSRFQRVKGRLWDLPFLGRLLIVLAALPGLALVILSVVVFAASLLALLLLAVPAYRLVTALTRQPERFGEQVAEGVVVEAFSRPVPSDSPPDPQRIGRRQVEVRIVEP